MAYKNILSFSSGKDSTAMLLLAIERGIEFEAVFADTGNEHEFVYEYLDYLENKLGIKFTRLMPNFDKDLERKRKKTIPNKWIKDFIDKEGMDPIEAAYRANKAIDASHPTGNPFLDLCILKGTFPSSTARWCTQELKSFVIEREIYMKNYSAGHRVISWQGIRKEESRSRSKMTHSELGEFNSIIYRPILDWTWQDVFNQHKRHGIDPNPLYKRGMKRVGCMPCIFQSKEQLATMAREFPEHIDRIEEWERIVRPASKRGKATFFSTSDVPGWPKDLDSIDPEIHGIRGQVEYARTTFGGRKMDLIEAINIHEAEEARAKGEYICRSAYGLCE